MQHPVALIQGDCPRELGDVETFVVLTRVRARDAAHPPTVLRTAPQNDPALVSPVLRGEPLVSPQLLRWPNKFLGEKVDKLPTPRKCRITFRNI